MLISEKLRSVTRPIHLLLHGHPLLRILTCPNITAKQLLYIQKALYGYWQPLQTDALFCMPTSPIVLWLEQDLRASGVDPSQLSLCRDIPPVNNEEQWLGLTYVKEGSLLGGQVMFKNISQTLPQCRQTLRFFQGQGRETTIHWRKFLQYLEQRSHELDHELICQSALNTFTYFKKWMDICEGQRRNTDLK